MSTMEEIEALLRPEDFDRLWDRVDTTGEHWLWTGGLLDTTRGYGRIVIRQRKYLTHRVAWLSRCGPIPSGQVVVVACGIPRCVRPDHLALATKPEAFPSRKRTACIVAGCPKLVHRIGDACVDHGGSKIEGSA